LLSSSFLELFAKCRIFFVGSWLFISAVISAVAKTYLLTSFGRAVGFFSDLAMCMALALALNVS
jgi:hypothetical protein